MQNKPDFSYMAHICKGEYFPCADCRGAIMTTLNEKRRMREALERAVDPEHARRIAHAAVEKALLHEGVEPNRALALADAYTARFEEQVRDRTAIFAEVLANENP